MEISSRASLVIAEIQEKYAKDSVLVVSHKATIRIILCELLGIDLGRYRDRIDMPAGLVSIVKFDVHGPTGIGRSCLLGRRCTFQTRNLSLPEVVGKLLKATLVGSISHQV